jgi:N-[(2S)-2-amino-2-carboxyethyl]-L-glutamate dehydrogenase
MTAPTFAVISGTQVGRALHNREKQVVGLIEEAYRLHGNGESVNPPSYFLRFPDRPASRIIALPASLGGEIGVDGIKWVSSFPANIESGLPRASATLMLNDQATGYPFACLEGSIISAARTAASAALAADWLSRGRGRPTRLGIFGTGLIARYVYTYLTATGWTFDEIGLHDLDPGQAKGLGGYISQEGTTARISVHENAEDLIRNSDLIVFATVAGTPHVREAGWFSHAPLVLHVSLRDLAEPVILASDNVVDDVDHCLRAQTSVHLAETATGNRNFLSGTLFDVMGGAVTPNPGRTMVFSPFGLGVLDLALGKYVYDEVGNAGELGFVDGFFADLNRHGRN